MTRDSSQWRFETKSVHAGYTPEPTTHAVAVPLYQTVAYSFDSAQHGADLFDLKVAGNIYTRIMNPTQAVLEERIAALEGGIAALALASGQAAITYAIQTITEAGDNIVASSALYGGTYNLFAHTLPQYGIQTRFADYRDPKSFEPLIDARTKAVFVESLGNPQGNITDIAAVAAIAHKHGVPLIVDNTVPSPYLCRPIEHGADIVMHSVTKFLGGHGVAIGGVVVDGGNFDWTASGKFPTMTEPYAGYHGIAFAEEFGPAAMIMRARAEGLRDFGACMSPANAFYLLQGVETLPVRMSRHVANAQAVAEFLEKNAAVAWVKYPGLASHPDRALAARQMPKGAGAILSFGIKGGRKAGARLIERLRVFSHLANVGDAKSLVIHPASTTHQQMSSEDLAKAGIGEELVRLSIGLEDAQDLLEDLSQALAASQKG